MTLTIAPTTGLFRGGTQIRLVGSSINVSACQDSFSNGAIAPLWSDISTGDGDVVERAVDRVLALHAGPAAASVAGVRSAGQVLSVDVEISIRLSTIDYVHDTSVVFGEIALQAVSGSARVALQLVAGNAGREIVIRVLAGSGATLALIRKTIASDTPVGTIAQLRILRAGRAVTLFLNGNELVRFDWVAALAYIELIARNDALIDTTVDTDIFLYERRPVVTLGGEPVRDLVRIGNDRASGSTPEVSCALDTVDVDATACSGAPFTLADGFTFYREPDLIRPSGILVVCNDPTLTIRRGR
jgi:hypothetical protein